MLAYNLSQFNYIAIFAGCKGRLYNVVFLVLICVSLNNTVMKTGVAYSDSSSFSREFVVSLNLRVTSMSDALSRHTVACQLLSLQVIRLDLFIGIVLFSAV